MTRIGFAAFLAVASVTAFCAQSASAQGPGNRGIPDAMARVEARLANLQGQINQLKIELNRAERSGPGGPRFDQGGGKSRKAGPGHHRHRHHRKGHRKHHGRGKHVGPNSQGRGVASGFGGFGGFGGAGSFAAPGAPGMRPNFGFSGQNGQPGRSWSSSDNRGFENRDRRPMRRPGD